MKYTTSVTITRRGTSDELENIVFSTVTRTTIGTALRAMASGVTRSSRTRKRISTNATAMPSTVPTTSPTSAFVPDVTVASQMLSALSPIASTILDGEARK